jgi:hypothetical protein
VDSEEVADSEAVDSVAVDSEEDGDSVALVVSSVEDSVLPLMSVEVFSVELSMLVSVSPPVSSVLPLPQLTDTTKRIAPDRNRRALGDVEANFLYYYA